MDLLNLNFASAVSGTAPKQSPSSNFDLLSGLNEVPNENFSTFDATAAPPVSQNSSKPDLFDPFASLGGGSSNDLLGGWGNFNTSAANTYPQNNVSEQTEQKQTDPFADLGMSIFYRHSPLLCHLYKYIFNISYSL